MKVTAVTTYQLSLTAVERGRIRRAFEWYLGPNPSASRREAVALFTANVADGTLSLTRGQLQDMRVTYISWLKSVAGYDALAADPLAAELDAAVKIR